VPPLQRGVAWLAEVNRRDLIEAFAALAVPKTRRVECSKPLGLLLFSKKPLVTRDGQIIVTDQNVYLPNEGSSFFVMNVAVGPILVHVNRSDVHTLLPLEAADFLHTDGEWRRIKAL
jgi:hypothetical protein